MQTQTLWSVEVRHLSGSAIRSEVMSSARLGGYFLGLLGESDDGRNPTHLFVVATPMRTRYQQMLAQVRSTLPPVKIPAEQVAAWVREAILNPPPIGTFGDLRPEPDREPYEPLRCPNCHQSDCDGCVPGYGDSLAERNAELAVERWRRNRP